MTGSAISNTLLTTQLNDLLKLDIDAVQAYTLAIRQMDSKVRQQSLRRYRQDHQRHITDLKRLIRSIGGTPIAMSHLPTGVFKLAMQALGSAGGDAVVLRAFKTNERQVRDKYRRAASRKGLPAEVRRVLSRAAADEERHYRWAEKSLARLGHPRSRTTEAVEVANARAVDALEAAEQPVGMLIDAARRGTRAAAAHPLRTAAALVAVTGAAGAAVALRRGR